MIVQKTITYTLLIELIFLITSTGSHAYELAEESTSSDITRNVCKEPRSQICTREYRPVCATLKDGSHKTYANGCEACADAKVTAFINEACSEVKNRN